MSLRGQKSKLSEESTLQSEQYTHFASVAHDRPQCPRIDHEYRNIKCIHQCLCTPPNGVPFPNLNKAMPI